MRIAHVSDIHIRNLKYHSEYRRVFQNFFSELEKRNIDLIVNTGDTAHTKTQISPEFVQLCSWFLTECAKRAPVVNVLGNHDLNLMNQDRQDAITPIVEALKNPRVILWKQSGIYESPVNIPGELPIAFYNFGIADQAHWPTARGGGHIRIGLFHGSVINCVTDSNFQMKQAEVDLQLFDDLDFVLMGDIHKRQSFKDNRIWYAGSMIQQNFGEELDKGFLIWDIQGTKSGEFSVEFVPLSGSRKFYTVRLNEDLSVPQIEVEQDSRVRISPPRPLTLVEQKTVEKIVKKRWSPHDVITLGAANIGQQTALAAGNETKIENLRSPLVQERLIRDFLKDRKLPEHILQKIIDLNRKYQVAVDQRDDIARNVKWRILKMGWNNLFNYGEGNVVDFSKVKGLSGIFAPNASGKSSLIDAITVGAFDANTKEVSKNIHLVNDNKDQAVVILEILADNQRYTIQRVIERIKYGQRTRQNLKEWGKTTLDFVRHDPSGAVESLVEESRPGTEKNIRRRLGTFDDFMLTSLSAQWNPMDIIACKETERKRILYKFLDLEIFEQKATLAKEESKEWIEKLADLEEGGYENALRELENRILETEQEIESMELLQRELNDKITLAQNDIEKLATSKVRVEIAENLSGLEDRAKRLTRAAANLRSSELSKRSDLDEKIKLRDDLDARVTPQLAHDLNVKKNELETFENEAVELAGTAKFLKSQIESLSKQVNLLSEVPCGDKFPACKFLGNAFEARGELPTLTMRLQEVNAKRLELQKKINELQDIPAKITALNREARQLADLSRDCDFLTLEIKTVTLEIEKNASELREITRKIESVERVKNDLELNRELDSQISLKKGEIVRLQSSLTANHRKILELTKKLGADQTVLVRIQTELATLKETRDTCTAYEHFLAAMGKDGIALQILTQKLPLINEEINKILGSATEFGVFIEYDQEEQSIRLNLQYGQYKSRLLELGSGAEKFLASLAIRAALLSISNLPKTNMFIIDEGFGKLDPNHTESVQRMFDYLKSVFDHVLIISHTDVMKDFVDNIIDITNDDEGYAHVSIE